VFEPTRRAADRVDAQRSETAEIIWGGIGRREFDGDGDPAQRFPADPGIMQIVFPCEFCAHVETVLGRELLDEPAHLSVTNNGEADAHALPRPVARS
jgi:hypothetical protein